MNFSASIPPDPAAIFLPGFECSGVPYMVTGGVSAIVYGEPRMTNDIDVVLALRPKDVRQFAGCFDPIAFSIPPIESLQLEAGREAYGHFNLHHLETFLRADVYLTGTDPLQAWGLDTRQWRRLGGMEGWVSSPEYVIVRKLMFIRDGASARHFRDIAWMLKVSAGIIDRSLLEAKIREQGVEREWAEAQRTPLDA